MWNTLAEVEEAVQFLVKFYAQQGTLPETVIETYKEHLKKSAEDLVLKFYDLLLDDYYVSGIIDYLN
ncbi:MAG: hypothetical protein HPY81_06425 [Firmicutes bacterium]|nr:hypothetical protein [Bacillota bacterium]